MADAEQIDLSRQIEEWKQEYGEVYSCEINGILFIYRPLTNFEYRRINGLGVDDSICEEIACQVCTLYPPDFDFRNNKAGYATTLASHILESSLLSSEEQVLKQLSDFRHEMDDYDFQMDCIIKEAFPDLDLEAIQHWPMKKRLWYFSRAEWVLGNLRNIRLAPANNQGPQAAPPHIQKLMQQRSQNTKPPKVGEVPPEFYNLPPEFQDADAINVFDDPEAEWFEEE